MNLVELKRLLAEAKLEPNWQCWDETKADLIVAAVNALPELIAIAELAGANAFESLSMAYAAGRADQRKADVEIARDFGGRNPPDGYASRENRRARRAARSDSRDRGATKGPLPMTELEKAREALRTTLELALDGEQYWAKHIAIDTEALIDAKLKGGDRHRPLASRRPDSAENIATPAASPAPAAGRPFKVGDRVRVESHVSSFFGQTGTVQTVHWSSQKSVGVQIDGDEEWWFGACQLVHLDPAQPAQDAVPADEDDPSPSDIDMRAQEIVDRVDDLAYEIAERAWRDFGARENDRPSRARLEADIRETFRRAMGFGKEGE